MSCLALALAGCQGGGSNPPPFNTGVAPPPSATTSASVTPSGGSVTTTLGTETVVITVPPGALSGPGTVAVTVFSNAAAPKTLHSAGRKVQTIGTDSVLIVEFSVTVTGATLLKPLQASLTTAPAPTGSIFRLAGFATTFDDVDTVTFAAGKATTDQNVLYSRMSLVSGTDYAFYIEPSSEASVAAKPVITVSNPSGNPVAMFGTAQILGVETQPNGFPYLDPAFTYALDNATIGALNATGLFTAGPLDGAGNVTVTDTTAGRQNPSGKGAVTVSSQRPGGISPSPGPGTTDSFTFTGTLSSTTQQTNSNITTQPQTDAATVALTSTVAGASAIATPVPAVITGSNSTETDTYPLETIKTGTVNVYAYTTGTAAGVPATVVPGTFAIVSSTATDSNGVVYSTQYNPYSNVSGNGILDVLPEKTGAFGPNNAVLQYDETDQAKFTRHHTVAADGSYVETGTDAYGDVQTINAHSDLSAFYDASQYSGYNFTITKPTGSPAKITVTIKTGNTNRGSLTIPSWIPASMTQPSTETDVDNGTTTYPAACKVPVKYGTSGNQIVQTINRADPALGNLESLTTTTYLSGTVGPVCIQMVDAVKTFYDYTLQNGFVLYVSGTGLPLQLTTVSETLTLQSATTSGGTVTNALTRGPSAVRATSSISPRAFAPVAFARSRFEHAVREKLGGMRTATFNRNFMSQGVQTL